MLACFSLAEPFPVKYYGLWVLLCKILMLIAEELQPMNLYHHPKRQKVETMSHLHTGFLQGLESYCTQRVMQDLGLDVKQQPVAKAVKSSRLT
jgi:hypothetical protein